MPAPRCAEALTSGQNNSAAARNSKLAHGTWIHYAWDRTGAGDRYNIDRRARSGVSPRPPTCLLVNMWRDCDLRGAGLGEMSRSKKKYSKNHRQMGCWGKAVWYLDGLPRPQRDEKGISGSRRI